MAVQERPERPWPFIGDIRDSVRKEHPSHFSVREHPNFDRYFEEYMHYHKSHGPEYISWYKEALKPILNKLRSVDWNADYDQRKEDCVLRKLISGGLQQLLIMSATAQSSTPVFDCSDEVRRKFLDSKEMEAYKHNTLLYAQQIPLQVLEAIVSLEKPGLQPPAVYKVVIDLILRFFSMPSFKEERPFSCLHTLDVYRKALLQRTYSREQPKFTKPPVIPSATKLHEARIGIKKSKTSDLMDVSFRKQTLIIPPLPTSAGTSKESIYHNLIWFERLDPCAGMHFSSGVYFMSNLLQDPQDSIRLKECGIINPTWNDGYVVKMFKDLCTHVAFSANQPMNHHLLHYGQRLRKRYEKNMEEWRKELYTTHLKTTWKIISLLAAFLILSLAIIQTVYTVLGYYKK